MVTVGILGCPFATRCIAILVIVHTCLQPLRCVRSHATGLLALVVVAQVLKSNKSRVYTASQILFSCSAVIKTTVTFLHRLPLSLPPPPPAIALTSTTTTTPIIWSTPTSHPAMLGEGDGVKNAPPSPPRSPLLCPPQENLAISPIVCRRPAKTSSPSRSWEATKTN